MEIKGFIKSSLLEWEGRLSSVLFLPTCNLRCRYCHAGDLVLHPERLDTVPLTEVLEYLRQNSLWLDGVAITGGEPTLHGPELLDLTGRIQDCGMMALVETNGTRPEWLRKLIEGGRVNALSMDVKAPLESEAYRRVTAVDVDVDAIRQSIEIIRGSGLEYELRITLVPGLVGKEELERMLPVLEGSRQIALQNFRPDDCLDPELEKTTPYQPEEMDYFARMCEGACERCVVRGRDHAVRAAKSPT
ncbi:MAG: anaerobic ribonucleoside-triphosphate reductase activating protein [Planctomycetes bacterium]|nr:anaerobic ribonucleoside-triphosphate reductase activating protein [Planctomycetota bacterium]